MRKAPASFLFRPALSRAGLAILAGATATVLSFEAKRSAASPGLVLAVLAVAGVCLYLEVWFFRHGERFAVGFAGERKIARALAPLEAEGYRVLGPKRLGRLRADIDQVVVGPTGVFAIEVKAWRGPLFWRGGRLYQGRRDQTWRVSKAVGHAMFLKKKIPPELGVKWVEAVTVFAEASPRGGCRHQKGYWTVPADDLVGFIRSRGGKLTNEECAYIASAVR